MRSPNDDDIDRLLSEGRPSGPARDRMFDAVMAKVDAAPTMAASAAQPATQTDGTPSGIRSLWDRLWRPLAVLAPVAAIGVIAVQQLSPSDVQARGDESAAFVEASCGAKDAPCRVGETVFLRLRTPQASPLLRVVLVTSTEKKPLAVLRDVSSDSSQPLSVKLKVEDKDAQTGIDLAVLDQSDAIVSTLRLNVSTDAP